jgi:hypothetical protein
MNIATIIQTDLTSNERDVLLADQERWMRMGAGAHLDDWLAYNDGLQIRRRLAMHVAHANRPKGNGYASAFSKLMADDGIDTTDKSAMHAFSAVMWLHDDPERMTVLREILNEMSAGERARLNSPISARQRVKHILKVRANGGEPQTNPSPLKVLKQALVDREHEIADLQERLAAAEQREPTAPEPPPGLAQTEEAVAVDEAITVESSGASDFIRGLIRLTRAIGSGHSSDDFKSVLAKRGDINLVRIVDFLAGVAGLPAFQKMRQRIKALEKDIKALDKENRELKARKIITTDSAPWDSTKH